MASVASEVETNDSRAKYTFAGSVAGAQRKPFEAAQQDGPFCVGLVQTGLGRADTVVNQSNNQSGADAAAAVSIASTAEGDRDEPTVCHCRWYKKSTTRNEPHVHPLPVPDVLLSIIWTCCMWHRLEHGSMLVSGQDRWR